MYKIIVKFKDKNSGRIYNVGEEVAFSSTRASEILKAGNFIEKVEEKAENGTENAENPPKKEAKKPSKKAKK